MSLPNPQPSPAVDPYDSYQGRVRRELYGLTHRARRSFVRGVSRMAGNLRAAAPMRGVDWVQRPGIVIPNGSRPGQVILDVVQRAVFDAMQEFGVKSVVWLKPPRAGSSTLTAWMMLFKALHEAQDTIFYERTETEAQRFWKNKLLPYWEASEAISHLKRGDTKTGVQDSWSDMYPSNGAAIQLRGVEVDGNFKAIRAEWVFIDEGGDKAYASGGADSEGNKIAQARTRYAEYPDGKLYLGGTPTTATCAVVVEYEKTDQRQLMMPFPCCDGPPQPFLPRVSQKDTKGEIPGGGLKFRCDDAGDVTEIGYECAHCAKWLDETQRNDLMELGTFVSKKPPKGPVTAIGFETWAIHAKDPAFIWSEIVKMYRTQLVDPTQQQVWANLWLAQPYVPNALGARDPFEMAQRCEVYDAPCPDGVLETFAGIDFQRGSESDATKPPRVEIVTIGVGVNEEKWVLGRRVIDGYYLVDPSTGEITGEWERIDPTGPEAMRLIWDHLDEGYAKADGTVMRASRVGVDTGYESTKVLTLCAHPESRRRKMVPLKGRSERPSHFGKRIPVLMAKPDRRSERSGLKATPIGTYSLKDYISQCLDVPAGEPFSWHFPTDLAGTDFFEQLTVEVLIEDLKKPDLTYWGKPRSKQAASNEALDCIVYALAAMHYQKAGSMKSRKQLALDPDAVKRKPKGRPGVTSTRPQDDAHAGAEASSRAEDSAAAKALQAAMAKLPPELQKALGGAAKAELLRLRAAKAEKAPAAPARPAARVQTGPRLSASEYARQLRSGQIKPAKPAEPEREERTRRVRPRANRLLSW